MEVGEHGFELGDVETGRSAGVDAEVALGDLAAEGQALEVEEARGALQIREGGWVLGEEAVEFRATGEAPAQHVDEIGVMLLEDAEEGDDIGADVVDLLGAGAAGAAQEDAAHANEGLGVGLVRDGVDDGAEAAGEIPLAADIGRGRG